MLGLVLAMVMLSSSFPRDDSKEINYEGSGDSLLAQVADDKVDKIKWNNNNGSITGELKSGEKIRSNGPPTPSDADRALFEDHGVTVQFDTPQGNFLTAILPLLLPLALFLGIFWLIQRRAQSQMGGIMSIGRSKAKTYSTERPGTTFADVAGYEGVKQEVTEVVDFLRHPERFAEIGARVPKGVLLVGPPGTGKTLIARAVAGEAGVPFLSVTGSDFMEMFVGVGASRVRDLFQTARKLGRAIIFVDEIDSIGRKRGAGLGGGHDEREQTLNQMLSEMDGFEATEGIVMMAATNRPDILDPALLRPGRFDRQITVDRPDLRGRLDILKVHARGKPLAPGIDLEVLARRTPGFTGADLANVVNEAALLSARHGRKEIADDELEEAIDRVIAGPERKTRVISDKEKRMIAYHESGHAIVGHALPNADPIHKVSVISRGRALGWTLSLPVEDKFLVTRSEMIDELAMLLGGRVAEELWFLDPTTGASNDIEKATQVARKMVCEYGMSDRLGSLVLGTKQENVFLGRDFGHQQDYSEQVAFEIDKEMRRLIDEAHVEAEQILTTYRDVADAMVEALMERETIGKEELAQILAPVVKRPARGIMAPPPGHVRSNGGRSRDEAPIARAQDGAPSD